MPHSQTDTVAAAVDYCITTMDRPRALRRLLLSIAFHAPRASIHIADQSERFDQKGYERLTEQMKEKGLEKRPTIQRLPFDCGVSVARNRLVDSTQGKYKLMLDDDFVFTKQTNVNALVKLLDAHPEAGIVGGGVIGNDGQLRHFGTQLRMRGRTIYQLAVADSFRTNAGLRFQEVDCVPMFTLMRRELFAHVRWDPLLKTAGEDLDFFLRVQDTPYAVLFTPDATIDHPPTENDMSYMHRRLRGEFLEKILLKHGMVRLRAISGAIAELDPSGQLIWYCERDAQR